MRFGDMTAQDMNDAAARHWERMVEPQPDDERESVHCQSCGDRYVGCPRCADDGGVK